MGKFRKKLKYPKMHRTHVQWQKKVPSLKTRKAPEALNPPLFSLPSGFKIYYGHVRYKPRWCKCFEDGDLSYLMRVCYDNINQDMTCLFLVNHPVLACVKRVWWNILIVAWLSLTQMVIVLLKCKWMPARFVAFQSSPAPLSLFSSNRR